MPELPEVESIARTLRPLVRNQQILEYEVRHPIAVRPQRPGHLRTRVVGRRVEEVERRGKYLLLCLSAGGKGKRVDAGCIVMHFRLDGQLIWFPRANRSPKRERNTAGDVHIDVALRFRSGTLGFADRRHFGRVHWYRDPCALRGIHALGVEPLSHEFTEDCLRGLLKESRRPLKLLLLDQNKVAGLGNIYSSESLWRARLSPLRPARRVTPVQARRLHKAIVDTLQRALKCCLEPAPDLRDPGPWFQGLEKILRVYGREGKVCRRCGGRIRRIAQGGRSTFYCARCQR